MFFRRPFRHRDNLNLGRPHKSSGSTKILAWLARWAISYGLPFAMGMMLMYVLLISLYMSHDHHHHQQQQTRAGHGRPKTIPEEYQWITSPRATKDGATCDPPLLCAWSLDHPRTQLASLNLWHKAATKPDQPLPTAAQSLEAAQKGHPTWVEQHYDQLNAWYTASDANFLHRTGVVHLHLPEDIHVIPMGGEAYFRRSLRDADLILDGLARSNGTLPAQGQDWLDFGGSHGRIAQIMAAAYPEAVWHVVDPIASTVQWAAPRLPRLQFSVMTDPKPPLPQYKDGQFTGIYALSIWSHYCEEAALVWLAEVYRLLAPGGRLWFSTHSHQALNFGVLDGAPVHPFRDEMMKQLYQKGHFYFPMFGTKGDFGVSDQHEGSWWGYGGFTTEWLAAHVLNGNPAQHWRMDYYGPGANENHQDVYVLTKLA